MNNSETTSNVPLRTVCTNQAALTVIIFLLLIATFAYGIADTAAALQVRAAPVSDGSRNTSVVWKTLLVAECLALLATLVATARYVCALWLRYRQEELLRAMPYQTLLYEQF